MAETGSTEMQSQPSSTGQPSQAGPDLSAERTGDGAEPRSFGPSDSDVAHSAGEGGSVRDPRSASSARTDPLAGSGEAAEAAGGKDRREDYGTMSGVGGTDRLTAGAGFADRLPEASSTPAAEASSPPGDEESKRD
jgi:hypothetical protein